MGFIKTVAAIVVGIVIVGFLAVGGCGLLVGKAVNDIEEEAKAEGKITRAQFEEVRMGMSYEQVCEVLGREGKEDSSNAIAGIRTTHHTWDNGMMSSVTCMFQNGRLISKNELGLD